MPKRVHHHGGQPTRIGEASIDLSVNITEFETQLTRVKKKMIELGKIGDDLEAKVDRIIAKMEAAIASVSHNRDQGTGRRTEGA